jgi:histone H3/H4
LLFDQELIFLFNMNDKLQQPEMLLIPKTELQRLYRKIREYEALLEQYQEQQQKYLKILSETKAS